MFPLGGAGYLEGQGRLIKRVAVAIWWVTITPGVVLRSEGKWGEEFSASLVKNPSNWLEIALS